MMEEIMKLRHAIINVLSERGFSLKVIGKVLNGMSVRQVSYIRRKYKPTKKEVA